MNEKIEKIRNDMNEHLAAAEQRISEARSTVEKAASDTQDAMAAKIKEAQAKVAETQSKIDAAKAKAQAHLEEKKDETEAAIEGWKRDREIKKLEKRADRDEDYAVSVVVLAVSAIEEAEVATLQAIVSRMDAEDAKA